MDLSQNDTVIQVPDGELVRLLLAGNDDAMAVIFDRYYRLLMGVALRILHDPSHAEDVVQITFLDFYEKAHLFDEAKGNLRTWLLQYTYGRSFNKKKRLRRQSPGETVGLNNVDEQRTPLRPLLNLERQDAVRFVHEILSQVTEKQRTVLQKIYFEDMDVSEVATRTGDSVGNVYHAYYRGMDKLREIVADSEIRPFGKSSAKELGNAWLRIKRRANGQLPQEVEGAKTRIL